MRIFILCIFICNQQICCCIWYIWLYDGYPCHHIQQQWVWWKVVKSHRWGPNMAIFCLNCEHRVKFKKSPSLWLSHKQGTSIHSRCKWTIIKHVWTLIFCCFLHHPKSGWWQLKYVLFSPRKLGKIPILTNIFQMRLKPPTSKSSFQMMRIKMPMGPSLGSLIGA